MDISPGTSGLEMKRYFLGVGIDRNERILANKEAFQHRVNNLSLIITVENPIFRD
jgi:hypothetical protein